MVAAVAHNAVAHDVTGDYNRALRESGHDYKGFAATSNTE
jgi:hypothetical protein